MRIAIGSDHGGFELKETLKDFLSANHEAVLVAFFLPADSRR
jgi:ribose 5-phosphate isomerase RpiB